MNDLILFEQRIRINLYFSFWTFRLFIYLFIYQLFWTKDCPEGMCTNGTQVPCEAPSLPNPTTRKGWPHHRSLRPLLFSNSDVGYFTSHKNKSLQVLWDGTYGFSSFSEKTRKSNHLQMSLQRQHFLHSYLKTLSVCPAGVWTRDLCMAGALPLTPGGILPYIYLLGMYRFKGYVFCAVLVWKRV